MQNKHLKNNFAHWNEELTDIEKKKEEEKEDEKGIHLVYKKNPHRDQPPSWPTRLHKLLLY